MLRERVRDGGTMIMTTHILEVAERMADRIGVIAHGRLVAEGTLDELRRQVGNDVGAAIGGDARRSPRASRTPSSRWSPRRRKRREFFRNHDSPAPRSGSRGMNRGSPGATGWR